MSLRRLLAALAVASSALVLVACGGGGGSPGECRPACPVSPPGSGAGTGSTDGSGTGSASGSGGTPTAPGDTTGSGTAGGDSTAGAGDGSGSGGTGASGSGTSGSGSSGSSSSGSGDSGSTGTGVAGGSGVGSGGTGIGDGTGVAGGVGSGGTGISGDGGVGSGGTGVTADASVGIGAVDGFGSIIVNGVRHEIGSATLTLTDGASLQLGITVRVAGTVSADLSTGTATSVASAPDVRGVVSALNAASGTFTVMGQSISTDDSTIFSGVAALTSLVNGDIVQLYGLPGTSGNLRATRIERVGAAASYVASGLVQSLDTSARTFRLGTVTVQYTPAMLATPLTPATLANGMVVRVTASAEPVAGVLAATQVQAWYTVPSATGAAVNLTGLVTDFAGLSSFRLQGVAVNASGAQVTGGPSSSVGNGVKVEVSGSMSGGALVVSKLKIRHVPGTGGPVSFSVMGNIGQYTSASNFRVQGQVVNASGAGVVFSGGTVADLANGKRVTVLGSQVVNGVLIAQSVTFN